MKTLKSHYQSLHFKYHHFFDHRLNNARYGEAARVYDFFSQRGFHSSLHDFTQHLSCLLKPKAQVLNMGGGTGLFDEILLDKTTDLELTVIEPCIDMFDILEQRLDDKAYLYHGFLYEYLNKIIPQDAFVFQRSLTHCLNHHLSLKQCCDYFYQITLPQGYVAVYQEPAPTDLMTIQQYYAEQCQKHQLNEQQLNEFWPLYCTLLKRVIQENKINAPIDTGTLLNEFLAAGFSCHTNNINDKHYFIVQKER